MPVYLCKPGWDAPEPWRHGIQVYAYPFSIPEQPPAATVSSPSREGRNQSDDAEGASSPQREESSSLAAQEGHGVVTTQNTTHHKGGGVRTRGIKYGMPVRRVRHAEVVLVDQVSIHYGRYWLRLRWPGPHGGFAGFIALGLVPPQHASASGPQPSCLPSSNIVPPPRHLNRMASSYSDGADQGTMDRDGDGLDESLLVSELEGNQEAEDGLVEESVLQPEEEDLEDDVEGETAPPRCESTGVYYPSSSAMELLASYDDGLSSNGGEDPMQIGAFPVVGSNEDKEPVFCRICREGLHDVNYDMDSATRPGPQQQIDEDGNPPVVDPPREAHAPTAAQQGLHTVVEEQEDHQGSDDLDSSLPKQQQQNPEAQSVLAAAEALTLAASMIVTHHPTAENPLLAPCECSGSMAFVHYLCVEQWRCRSRHPSARNGLNCETCGGTYSLPPPPSRPVAPQGGPGEGGVFAEDDWLEAMPPHVLAALRRPHPWWQIGAAVVRRRWLRPVAPIIMSPVVALYCRARRMLKKRGVSRRRWACSLCRRRARWKCVRCLRSYYCSRQCQNVSWHIVHKHVCYKPARFWWSVIVYGAATLSCFPGILKEPLVYDLGLALLPLSFFVMGVIGGGMATFAKKCVGVDLRGRWLELTVVLQTLWLAMLTWGLVWAFFGQPEACWGWVGTLSLGKDMGISRWFHSVFRPFQAWFLLMDRIPHRFASSVLCTSTDEERDVCYDAVSLANPGFFLHEEGGEKCAADLMSVMFIYALAVVTLFWGDLVKRRERDRRAQVAGHAHGHGHGHAARAPRMDRPHQD